MKVRTRAHAAMLGVALSVPVILVAGAIAAAGADASVPTAATTAGTNRLLQAMVVEEKLAHDVYVTLAQGATGIRQMSNISRSETRHLESVRSLLASRGVADPTAGDAVGVFDDAKTQALYDKLVVQGRTSKAQAVQVGITIEKLDIADLKKGLAAGQPADVAQVLSSLLQGSYRHLAAFNSAA